MADERSDVAEVYPRKLEGLLSHPFLGTKIPQTKATGTLSTSNFDRDKPVLTRRVVTWRNIVITKRYCSLITQIEWRSITVTMRLGMAISYGDSDDG